MFVGTYFAVTELTLQLEVIYCTSYLKSCFKYHNHRTFHFKSSLMIPVFQHYSLLRQYILKKKQTKNRATEGYKNYVIHNKSM